MKSHANLSNLDSWELYNYCRQNHENALEVWSNTSLRKKIDIILWGALASRNELLATRVRMNPSTPARIINNLPLSNKLPEKIPDSKYKTALSDHEQSKKQPEKGKESATFFKIEKTVVPVLPKKTNAEIYEETKQLAIKENNITPLLSCVIKEAKQGNHEQAQKILKDAVSIVDEMPDYFGLVDEDIYNREMTNVKKATKDNLETDQLVSYLKKRYSGVKSYYAAIRDEKMEHLFYVPRDEYVDAIKCYEYRALPRLANFYMKRVENIRNNKDINELEEFYLTAPRNKIKLEDAIKFYSFFAEKKFPQSMYMLAYHYHNGIGTQQDEIKAEQLANELTNQHTNTAFNNIYKRLSLYSTSEQMSSEVKNDPLIYYWEKMAKHGADLKTQNDANYRLWLIYAKIGYTQQAWHACSRLIEASDQKHYVNTNIDWSLAEGLYQQVLSSKEVKDERLQNTHAALERIVKLQKTPQPPEERKMGLIETKLKKIEDAFFHYKDVEKQLPNEELCNRLNNAYDIADNILDDIKNDEDLKLINRLYGITQVELVENSNAKNQNIHSLIVKLKKRCGAILSYFTAREYEKQYYYSSRSSYLEAIAGGEYRALPLLVNHCMTKKHEEAKTLVECSEKYVGLPSNKIKFAEAIKCYSFGAEKKHIPSMYMLAYHHHNGIEFKKDEALAEYMCEEMLNTSSSEILASVYKRLSNYINTDQNIKEVVSDPVIACLVKKSDSEISQSQKNSINQALWQLYAKTGLVDSAWEYCNRVLVAHEQKPIPDLKIEWLEVSELYRQYVTAKQIQNNEKMEDPQNILERIMPQFIFYVKAIRENKEDPADFKYRAEKQVVDMMHQGELSAQQLQVLLMVDGIDQLLPEHLLLQLVHKLSEHHDPVSQTVIQNKYQMIKRLCLDNLHVPDAMKCLTEIAEQHDDINTLIKCAAQDNIQLLEKVEQLLDKKKEIKLEKKDAFQQLFSDLDVIQKSNLVDEKQEKRHKKIAQYAIQSLSKYPEPDRSEHASALLSFKHVTRLCETENLIDLIQYSKKPHTEKFVQLMKEMKGGEDSTEIYREAEFLLNTLLDEALVPEAKLILLQQIVSIPEINTIFSNSKTIDIFMELATAKDEKSKEIIGRHYDLIRKACVLGMGCDSKQAFQCLSVTAEKQNDIVGLMLAVNYDLRHGGNHVTDLLKTSERCVNQVKEVKSEKMDSFLEIFDQLELMGNIPVNSVPNGAYKLTLMRLVQKIEEMPEKQRSTAATYVLSLPHVQSSLSENDLLCLIKDAKTYQPEKLTDFKKTRYLEPLNLAKLPQRSNTIYSLGLRFFKLSDYTTGQALLKLAENLGSKEAKTDLRTKTQFENALKECIQELKNCKDHPAYPSTMFMNKGTLEQKKAKAQVAATKLLETITQKMNPPYAHLPHEIQREIAALTKNCSELHGISKSLDNALDMKLM